MHVINIIAISFSAILILNLYTENWMVTVSKKVASCWKEIIIVIKNTRKNKNMLEFLLAFALNNKHEGMIMITSWCNLNLNLDHTMTITIAELVLHLLLLLVLHTDTDTYTYSYCYYQYDCVSITISIIQFELHSVSHSHSHWTGFKWLKLTLTQSLIDIVNSYLVLNLIPIVILKSKNAAYHRQYQYE